MKQTRYFLFEGLFMTFLLKFSDIFLCNFPLLFLDVPHVLGQTGYQRNSTLKLKHRSNFGRGGAWVQRGQLIFSFSFLFT
jgi:hypothetical protein